MRAIRRALYTLVFSIFFLIFAGVARDVLERFDPTLVVVPNIVTGAFLVKWISIFTVIVLLSFWGAGLIVYRNASGREKDLFRGNRFDRD